MSSPLVVEGMGFRLDCGTRTFIMGILNSTPDSFSDGGSFYELEKAVAHGRQMVEDGADILDVGGESTRPGAEEVSLDEELRRVIPVIEALAATLSIPLSIDTRKAEVARQAIRAGARIVNDVSGMSMDQNMGRVVADAGTPVVLMHSKGVPKEMQQNPWYRDTVGEIKSWLGTRIEAARLAGVLHEQIIIDPGIGFGKRISDNLLILKSLNELRPLGCPILIGPSRKSFIGHVLGGTEQDRMEGTAAAIAVGIANGAHLIRVHDVKQMARIARMTDAILNAAQE